MTQVLQFPSQPTFVGTFFDERRWGDLEVFWLSSERRIIVKSFGLDVTDEISVALLEIIEDDYKQ